VTKLSGVFVRFRAPLHLSEQYFLRFIYISKLSDPYIGKFLLIFTYSRMFILILPYLFQRNPNNCWIGFIIWLVI
jgi:hypothetical protein